MDFVNGGDLRYHIGRQQRFSESQTKFFVACILIGLEFLHINGIMHRDIKPENLVLDGKGYARITDLGIAKKIGKENGQDTSGTPGYMAPEVLCRQSHGIAVDYFALGVMAYEFMLGHRPYLGRCRKEIMDAILAKQVQVKPTEIPIGWSLEAVDFINKLIQRKPHHRLGYNGPSEVKDHPWFKNFPWEKLLSQQLTAGFIPRNIDDNYDYQQQISLEDTTDEVVQQTSILLKKHSIQNVFEDYDYQFVKSEIQQQKQLEGTLNIGNIISLNQDFPFNFHKK